MWGWAAIKSSTRLFFFLSVLAFGCSTSSQSSSSSICSLFCIRRLCFPLGFALNVIFGHTAIASTFRQHTISQLHSAELWFSMRHACDSARKIRRANHIGRTLSETVAKWKMKTSKWFFGSVHHWRNEQTITETLNEDIRWIDPNSDFVGSDIDGWLCRPHRRRHIHLD